MIPARYAHSAHRELPHVLAKISYARFGKPSNAETAAVAEINLVGIQLEDLLLIKTLLEFDRDHRFGDFAPHRALVRKEKRARHLHGDGARALVVRRAVPKVGPRGAHDSNEVKSAVVEKPLVLRRKNRVYQFRRQIFIPHRPPLFPARCQKDW